MLTETEKRKYSGDEDAIVEKKQAILDNSLVKSKLEEVSPLHFNPVSHGDNNSLTCSLSKFNSIAGIKGANITEIMKLSCCKLLVDPELPGDNSRVIKFVGLPESIEAARELCLLMIDFSSNISQLLLSGAIETSEMSNIPENKVKIIIGAKGVTINEIMRRSGTRIVIIQDMPRGIPRIARITGRRIQILQAKSLIANIIKFGTEFFSSNTLPGDETVNNTASPASSNIINIHYMQAVLEAQQAGNSPELIITSEMDVSQDKVPAIIGSKGSVIANITKQTGCRMTILQDGLLDGQPRKIHFTGSAHQIGAAMVFVSNIITKGSALARTISEPGVNNLLPAPVRPDFITQEVTVTGAQLNKLCSSPSGNFIVTLKQKYDVDIAVVDKFSEGGNKIIRITGEGELVNISLSFILRVINGENISLSSQRCNECLGLGFGGNLGSLQEKIGLSDGFYQQAMIVNKENVEAVTGVNGSYLKLVRLKSGAIVIADRADKSETTVKFVILGSEECVVRCAQIFQEISVYGTDRVEEMNDVESSVPVGYIPAQPMNQISLPPSCKRKEIDVRSTVGSIPIKENVAASPADITAIPDIEGINLNSNRKL